MTKWLKEDTELQTIPVVAVTAFAMRDDEERIRDGGCDAYLSKPISVPKFIETIRRFLGVRQSMQPLLAQAEERRRNEAKGGFVSMRASDYVFPAARLTEPTVSHTPITFTFAGWEYLSSHFSCSVSLLVSPDASFSFNVQMLSSLPSCSDQRVRSRRWVSLLSGCHRWRSIQPGFWL